MLKLFQFPANRETHNLSPFCLKLETYLRLSGIPFEVITETMPFKGPKGKLPFIEEEGKRVADSHFIIEHLKAKYGDQLDARLSAQNRALGTLITRMFESDLYFALVYFRWVDADGWKATRERVLGRIPVPMKWFIQRSAKKRTQNVTWAQGIGRHSREEIVRHASADLDAASEILGDQDYFLGSKPTSVDATAYGFLKNFIDDSLDTPLNRYARSKRNLVAYVARMDKTAYATDAAPKRDAVTAKARPSKKAGARRKA